MIKLSHWIIDQGERILNPTHTSKRIRGFVLRKNRWVINHVGKMVEPNKAEIAYDLWQIHEKISELGWVKSKKNPFDAFCSRKQFSTAKFLAWKRNLWDGKVIHAGMVKAGAGFYLDQFVLKERNNQGSFIVNNLESLLKHVETKRDRCLGAFNPPLDKQNIWVERINITLLFARAARLGKDPRFLNAALKLNDWYFSYLQKHATLPEMARFLLALVEQELAFKELYF